MDLPKLAIDLAHAIVLNPPSKGAKKQLKEVILSNVPNIVYVSCNLKTFARDAKFLLENGYSLEWLKPIDQFPNTMHLEIVSKFIEKTKWKPTFNAKSTLSDLLNYWRDCISRNGNIYLQR